MTFAEFVDAADGRLAHVGGRILQRREADPEPGFWWLTFRRAAIQYRLRFDMGVNTLFFEKEQGSFRANSAPTWQSLDFREPPDLSFEAFLDLIEEVVRNRWDSGSRTAN